MLWVLAGSLVGSGLVYWLWPRRATPRGGFPVGWCCLSGASGIAVLGSLALNEHRLGTADSLYTGFYVSEVLGLLVLSWSAGTGVMALAARPLRITLKQEDKPE